MELPSTAPSVLPRGHEVGLAAPFLACNLEISSKQTCSVPPVVPHGAGANVSLGLA